MPSRNMQRTLCFLLSLVLLFPLIPCTAFATDISDSMDISDEEAPVISEDTNITADAEIFDTASLSEETPNGEESHESGATIEVETALLQYILDALADYVIRYKINPDMTDAQLADAYIALDSEAASSAWSEAWELDAMSSDLSTEAQAALSEDENAHAVARFIYVIDQMMAPQLLADGTYGNVTVSGSGVSTGTDSWSASATATPVVFWYNAGEISITVSGSVTTESTISFNWTATGAASLTINGETTSDTSGTFSKTVTGNFSYNITAKSAASKNATVTFNMTNISCVEKTTSSAITVNYASALGSVTKDSDTAVLASGAVVNITEATTFTAAVTASNAAFIGWKNDSNNKLLTTSKTCTVESTGAQSITAVFATDSPWFLIDGRYLIEGLSEATNERSSGILVLMNTATLKQKNDDSGNPVATTYNIPSGVTLLIPYADTTPAHTNPLTTPERLTESSSPPTLFRKLTVASGVTINCSGNIRVDSRQSALSTQYSGRMYGAYGQIHLNNGAVLNLASGSTLRAYGYITGAGTVNASSATIYELFQMSDWRGGSNISKIYEGLKNQSFPVSQFYVQNIESNLVVDSGTTMNALVSIAAGLLTKTEYSSQLQMVGSEGMFQLEDTSTLTRTYTSSGRIQYTLNGTTTVGSISLSINTGTNAITLNSADYVLSLPSNMTIKIASGTTTFPVRVKLLPSTELIIDKGSTLNMTSGAELILYDYDDWTGGNYTYNGKFFPVQSSPTGRMTSLTANAAAKFVVDGTLNIEDGAAIYSTNNVNTANGNNALTNTQISGTITLGTAPSTLRTTISEVNGSSSDLVSVAVTPLQALLKGISTSATDYTHSMANSKTYHSLGDNYWYNYKVTAVDNFGNPAASAVTVTPEIAAGSDSSKSLIGYITYNAAGTQSAFNFTTNLLTVKNGDTTLTPTDGVYSLTSINADTQLTLTRIIAGTSVRAGDCLDIYFWISGLGGKGYTAKFSDGKEVAFDDWTLDKASGMYRVVYNGIVAREMPETVSVAIYKDNVQVSETATESIEGYALRTLEKNDNTYLQTTLVDMLNYGAAAQTYFRHNEGNLANAELTTTQQGYGTQTEPNTVDDMKSITSTQYVSFAGANVTAGTTLYLSFYFNGITDANKSNFKAVLTYTDHYGDAITRTIAGSDFKLKDGYYGPQLTGLAVADGRKLVNCKIYNGEDLVAEAQSSIAGYAARTIANNADNTNLVNVCKNLIKFIDSAVVYFDSL